MALSASFNSQEAMAVSKAFSSTFSAACSTSSSIFFSSRSIASEILSFISAAMFSSCFFASSHPFAKSSSESFWEACASCFAFSASSPSFCSRAASVLPSVDSPLPIRPLSFSTSCSRPSFTCSGNIS